MIEGLQYLVNIIPSDMLWNMETADDFESGGNYTGIDVGTNKVLYVLRESESNLVTSTNGISTISDTTPSASSQWQASQNHSNVIQTSTSGSGTGARFAIVTNGGGGIDAVVITSGGRNYAVNDTVTLTDPGSSSSTAVITVATVVASASTQKMLVECREVPASLRGRIISGSGWKEEATETDPVWYKYNGKVHIAPESASTNSKAFWVKVPPTAWVADADEQTYMAGTILLELEPLVMAYVVKKCFERKLALAQLGTSTSLEVYVEDEDIDLAQAQQLLIGDLMQTIALKEKALQIGIASFMKGTVEPETAKDMKRVPTYTHLGQQA
jgi:hypothetical protein